MKFIIENSFRENIYGLMRKAGYYFKKKDEFTSEIVFTRPARGFPRFHIHLKEKNNCLLFNLHLDQKQPIYGKNKFGQSNGWQKLVNDKTGQRFSAHSGEYDGNTVEEEAERIKKVLQGLQA